MIKNILVFTTDNADLPKNYKTAEEDINNYPNVLKFSAVLISIDIENPLKYSILFGRELYIKPFRNNNPIAIHPKATLTHGIDFNRANALGENIEAVAIIFQGLLASADAIVCHNYTLHRNIMATELLKLGIKPIYKNKAKILCLMKFTTGILKLPSKLKNQFRFPKIEQIFEHYSEVSCEEYYKDTERLKSIIPVSDSLALMISKNKELQEWFKGEKDTIY